MSRDGYLPDGVTEDMLPGSDDHILGCPRHEDASESCVCGHRKEPDGDEPGHRNGVCQGNAPNGHMPCGCDGYESAECRCAEIMENREASKADAAEARAEERRYARD